MQIVRIFDERLFSIQYDDEEKNELRRCLEAWNTATHVFEFLKANKHDLPNRDIYTTSEQIFDDVADLQELLEELGSNPKSDFETMFVALDNTEYKPVVLSRRKKRAGYLRIYAIRIDKNCFLVTGGAIKLTHRMEERQHTARELQKLNAVRDMLGNKVFQILSPFLNG